jgi:hypothetical protein
MAETGFCPHLPVKYIQLGLIDIGSPYKNGTMDNFEHNVCINVPSSQNFTSYIPKIVYRRHIYDIPHEICLTQNL